MMTVIADGLTISTSLKAVTAVSLNEIYYGNTDVETRAATEAMDFAPKASIWSQI